MKQFALKSTRRTSRLLRRNNKRSYIRKLRRLSSLQPRTSRQLLWRWVPHSSGCFCGISSHLSTHQRSEKHQEILPVRLNPTLWLRKGCLMMTSFASTLMIQPTFLSYWPLFDFLSNIRSVMMTSQRLISLFTSMILNWYRYIMTFGHFYLLTISQLYSSNVIKPNHHYATHVADCSRNFGPLHDFWTFLYKQLNKVLKSFKINNHGKGELETTFFREFQRMCDGRLVSWNTHLFLF